jgi:hypothetical protein
MDFHDKYRDLPECFKLLEIVVIQTDIIGYEFEDCFVKLTKEGLLYIFPGFEWSASGPTVDSPWTRRASLYHDAIYYIANFGVFKGKNSKKIRKIADVLFYNVLREDLKKPKMEWYVAVVVLPVRYTRAELWYRSVRVAGGSYWEAEYEDDSI